MPCTWSLIEVKKNCYDAFVHATTIENLWHYMRSHHWSNRNYDYDALADAAIDSWQRVALKNDMVQSICHAAYLESALIV